MREAIIPSMVTKFLDGRARVPGDGQFESFLDDLLLRRGGETNLVGGDVYVVVGKEVELCDELLGSELRKVSSPRRKRQMLVGRFVYCCSWRKWRERDEEKKRKKKSRRRKRRRRHCCSREKNGFVLFELQIKNGGIYRTLFHCVVLCCWDVNGGLTRLPLRRLNKKIGVKKSNGLLNELSFSFFFSLLFLSFLLRENILPLFLFFASFVFHFLLVRRNTSRRGLQEKIKGETWLLSWRLIVNSIWGLIVKLTWFFSRFLRKNKLKYRNFF